MEYKQSHERYLDYLKGYGVSSLYLLSQMDHEGRRLAMEHFNKKGLHLSTRELEDLKQQYPRWQVDRRFTKRLSGSTDETTPVRQIHELEAFDDCNEMTTDEMIEQFILLAQSINWAAVGTDSSSCQRLSSIQDTLSFVAGLANEPFCSALV